MICSIVEASGCDVGLFARMLARIRAVLRRTDAAGSSNEIIEIEKLRIDTQTHRVSAKVKLEAQ